MDARRTRINNNRTAAALINLVVLSYCVPSTAADSKPHFHLEAGDASLMLNEFSRQSDLQVLFDFNILKGIKSQAVDGDLEPSTALKLMLQGTNLIFGFVNDRTLAVTPKPSLFQRWWSHFKRHSRSKETGPADIVISANQGNGEPPPPGAHIIDIGREQLERSGIMVTVSDFLRTRPELFGGGPAEGTVLGTEQASNTALGTGANYRGLGAGVSVVVINGRPIAPSGSDAAFTDVSNIPLSVVDHIQMIPEGATALYGGGAVGGVINFVLRDQFDGSETQAHASFAQGRTLGEQQLSQLWGTHWGEASTLLAFEYYRRDALAASDRAEATSNLTPFGGDRFDSLFGNPGTLLVGSQTYAIPRGQDGRALSASDVQAGTVSLHDLQAGSDILPAQRRVNLYTHSTLPFTDNTRLFADALLADRAFSRYGGGETGALLTVPTSNPYYFNPTGDRSKPVQVMYGFLSDLGPMKLSGNVRTGNVAVGMNHISASGWNTKSEVGYAYETQHTQVDNIVNPAALDVALADPTAAAFNPFGDGSHTSADTLSKIRSQSRLAVSSTYWFARVLADGPLLSIPGGDLKLVAGSEWYGQGLAESSTAPGQQSNDRLYRNASAAFGELRLPIFGVTNRVKGIESLELSAAERIERYSDVGTVSTPSFSAAWSPTAELRFRATEASVFKAPNLGDLSTANAGSELTSLPDPQSGTGQSLALVTFGGNPRLRPERGRSWSVGFDWAPGSIPGLTLSVTHFDIYLEGRVNSLTLDNNVLGGAPRYASFVNRDPTPEQRALACNRGTLYGGDLQSCLSAQGPIVDGEWLNLSRTRTNGYDLTAKYALTTEVGQFDFGLDGTRTMKFAQSFTAADPMIDLVNTDHNPPALRARASFNYRLGRFGTSFWVNYTGHYRDIDSIPQRSVSAWTTLDAQVSYDLQSLSESAFKDLHLTFSVQNAFGSSPPFLNNQLGLGWDQENATPWGRQISFAVRKRF